jgi:hypothetical protein
MSATVPRSRRLSEASNDIASYVFNHSRDDVVSPAAPVYDATPNDNSRRLSVATSDIAQYLGLWSSDTDNASQSSWNKVTTDVANYLGLGSQTDNAIDISDSDSEGSVQDGMDSLLDAY